MKLYSYWRSSSSWRVRIALNWKGLPYTYAAVNLLAAEQRAPGYREVNPSGTVPSLECEGTDGAQFRLSQSLAILEYLEERFPTPPLYPGTAEDRARVRQLSELVNSGVQPFQNLQVLKWVKEMLGADEKAWAAHWVAQGLASLEAHARSTAGRYLYGDQVTAADLCLVPQLFGARRFSVDLSPFPTLTRVESALEALPAFAAARPEAQPDAAAS